VSNYVNMNQDDLEALNRLKVAVGERVISVGWRSALPATEDPSMLPMIGTFIANQHSETTELWEAARNGALFSPCDKAPKMEANGLQPLTCAEEEVADIMIRLLDLSHYLGIDLAKAVLNKQLYNASRPHRHGGKLA